MTKSIFVTLHHFTQRGPPRLFNLPATPNPDPLGPSHNSAPSQRQTLSFRKNSHLDISHRPCQQLLLYCELCKGER